MKQNDENHKVHDSDERNYATADHRDNKHIHADNTARGDDEHHHDDDDHSGGMRNLAIAVLMFISALLIEHLPQFAPNGAIMQRYGMMPQTLRLSYTLLYLAAYLTCGRSVVLGAARNIARGSVFDEQFLMTVASLGAVCMGEFAEAVAVMLFYQIGEYFQDYAVNKSRNSISALMAIRGDHALVLRDGTALQVHPDDVAVGELIELRPGERLALDGVVESGESFVDTSALTGESVPRHVIAGSELLAGTVNVQGALTVRVTRPYGESAVTRILELTEQATAQKARSERFITRFARVYTPVVCLLAVCVAVLPPLALRLVAPDLAARYGWSIWLHRALLFLVVSCPCALVISVPLSFFSGIGAASRHGVLVKGSNFVEALASVRTAVFDKTGTLTKGTFTVTRVRPAVGASLTADELITVAAHAERHSNHPISRSLKAAHSCPRCATVACTDVQELGGKGIAVTVDGSRVLAGNAALMAAHSIADFGGTQEAESRDTGDAEPNVLDAAHNTTAPADDNAAGTLVHVAMDGRYCGHIVISDEPKADAAAAIASLRKLGVKKTVMLTGDSETTAARVAAELGVDAVYANLLPEDKVSQLEKLLAEDNGTVLFAGDGVNDAPVLARADVGVAMGALGSDAAIEAADVVIMDDSLLRLADAIRISRATCAVVRQNIVFALGVKAAVMALGAVGIVNMWGAVFGDVGVTLLCVMNALRLLRPTKKQPCLRDTAEKSA